MNWRRRKEETGFCPSGRRNCLNQGNKKAPDLKPNKKSQALQPKPKLNYTSSDRTDGNSFKLFLTDKIAPKNRPYLAE
jgi:hypothetical protein